MTRSKLLERLPPIVEQAQAFGKAEGEVGRL